MHRKAEAAEVNENPECNTVSGFALALHSSWLAELRRQAARNKVITN